MGVSFQLNFDTPFGDADELERAVELARDADAAIVVVGTTPEVESEGFDRTSLALPGPPGRARPAHQRREPEDDRRSSTRARRCCCRGSAEVPAVLLTWFPGQEAGNALADVILGVAEPGGRLPTTWPASEEGLPR